MTDLITFQSRTLRDTLNFARDCANSAQNGDIYALHGPMGSGKSEFCRAFIQHLTQAPIDVPSPTFTMVQTYETQKGLIWHFDLYRLEYPEEVYEIGWEEALSDGLLLIEWPEKLGHLMPSSHKDIIITPDNHESRKIELYPNGKDKL